MKNIGIIIAAVVILLLVAVGGVLLLKYSKAPAQPTSTTNTKAIETQSSNSITGTIKDLMGKTEVCAISYPNSEIKGTIYVSGNKFRGDFTIKRDGTVISAGNAISDGTYLYAWNSATSMGIKMKVNAIPTAPDGKPQGVDINQKINLNCSPWIVDNSKFTIPSDIKFTDMTQTIQKVAVPTTVTAPKTGTGTSPCDQIADPTAKAACAKALQGQGY
jgi:hypothetical protein